MQENNRIKLPIDDLSKLLPGVSIDCVIFGFDKGSLHLLVLKWQNLSIWALPSGFIYKDEDMDRAAIRALQERTGLKLPYLRQFHTFGKVARSDNLAFSKEFKPSDIPSADLIAWLKQRFISAGYLSLVDMRNSNPSPDIFSEACQWKPLGDLPPLIFDHRDIVNKALEQLRHQINYLPIGLSLLPEKFTMKDLQLLYEEILQRKLDRGNFQKKMLKLDFLDRHEKQLTGAAHKAPYLYSFNKAKYNELLEKGIGYIS